MQALISHQLPAEAATSGLRVEAGDHGVAGEKHGERQITLAISRSAFSC